MNMVNRMVYLPINKCGEPVKVAVFDDDKVISLNVGDIEKLLLQFTEEERLEIFSKVITSKS